nr:uncharacterized protein LOC128685308 [Cherax quadricarinatus]
MKMLVCLAGLLVSSLAQDTVDLSQEPVEIIGGVHTVLSNIAGRHVTSAAHRDGRPVYGRRPHSRERPVYGYLGSSQSCTYWCTTPQNKFYCCYSAINPTTTHKPVRSGCCPAVQAQCSRVEVLRSPLPCINDNSCSNLNHKCCFNGCLKKHVCQTSKPCNG